MVDQRMLGFWVASGSVQGLCGLSACVFILRHWPSQALAATSLNLLKQKVSATVQFPSNELGRQLQCNIFWVIMLVYFFVGMGMLVQRQSDALIEPLSTHAFNAAIEDMVYVLCLIFVLLFPKSINTQSLMPWILFHMAFSVVVLSPFAVPGEEVRNMSKATALHRFALSVACPRTSVVPLFHAVHYAFGSFWVEDPSMTQLTLLFHFNLEGLLIISAAFLVRFFVGEWVNVNVQLQSQKVETVALRNLLGMLCDAVVELDPDLILTEHSPQLSTLLLQASFQTPSPPSLKCVPLAKFLPNETERDRVEAHLKVHSQGGASAIHTSMVDALGNQVDVELLHVSFSVSKHDRHILVGIREAQKDTVSLNIGSQMLEFAPDESCTRFDSDMMIPNDAIDRGPQLLFSLDSEKVLKANDDWVKFIRPLPADYPMSEVLGFSPSGYDSFFSVLQQELNNIHSDHKFQDCRVVYFQDIPLPHFQASGKDPLKGEVRVFENEDGTQYFGILTFCLEDVLGLGLAVPEEIRSRGVSSKMGSPMGSRSSSRSSKSSRSKKKRRRVQDQLQPDEGSILDLRNMTFTAPLHL